jgi:LysM domain
MDTGRRSPLRILPPIAIVAFGVALVVVVSGGGGGGGGGTGANAAEKARDLGPTVRHSPASSQRRRTGRSGQLPQRVYIVKQGDTLGGIAQKTGVPVSRLQDLNPGLDQFSLQTGQQIKLR